MSGTSPATSAHIADTTTRADARLGHGTAGGGEQYRLDHGPGDRGNARGVQPAAAAGGRRAGRGRRGRADPSPAAAPAGAAALAPLGGTAAPVRSALCRLPRRWGSRCSPPLSIVQQTLAFRIQDTLALDTRTTAQTYGYTMMTMASASLFAQAVLVQRLKLPPVLLLRAGMPLLAGACRAADMGRRAAGFLPGDGAARPRHGPVRARAQRDDVTRGERARAGRAGRHRLARSLRSASSWGRSRAPRCTRSIRTTPTS